MNEQCEKFNKKSRSHIEQNRNPRADEYNEKTEKFNRELQKPTQSCRGKNQKTQG